MIRLHPSPNVSFEDPLRFGEPLTVEGWSISGMRMMVQLRSLFSGHCYLGDLPCGHGLVYPMLLDKTNGEVLGSEVAPWFSRLLLESWRKRISRPVHFSVEVRRRSDCAVLLNCLDYQYGHCLLKLLNAATFKESEESLIILLPRALRWLCPHWAAEIWTVDEELNFDWNEWLDARVHSECRRFREVFLAPGIPHPSPNEFCMEDFTSVPPFDMANWVGGLDSPCLTIIWREDRCWSDPGILGFRREWGWRLSNRLGRRPDPRRWQREALEKMIRGVKIRYPGARFTVCGVGPRYLSFSGDIEDLREEHPNEETERLWVSRYAQSHFVIGVHGSGMLLPTAHAGAGLTLITPDKWRNLGQDNLVAESDPRRAWLRSLFVPATTSADEIAMIICESLERMAAALCNFKTGNAFSVSEEDCAFAFARERRKASGLHPFSKSYPKWMQPF